MENFNNYLNIQLKQEKVGKFVCFGAFGNRQRYVSKWEFNKRMYCYNNFSRNLNETLPLCYVSRC